MSSKSTRTSDLGLNFESLTQSYPLQIPNLLLRIVESGRLDATKLISHRFKLSDIMDAYDTFGNAAKEGALKVLLSNA